MVCLKEISICAAKVSRTTWRSAFSFGAFVEWGERARSLSLSLSLCMWAETGPYFEINQTRDSCSACSCSRLAIYNMLT